MADKQNTTELFLGQIGNHTEELAGLLAVGPSQSIEPEVAERALLCTSMLLNSTSVLEITSLSTFLRAYEGLLGLYFEKRLPWDERIAQLTSEVIELEDQWVSAGQGKTTSTIHDIFSSEQLGALTQEAADVRSFAETLEFSETIETPRSQQPVTPESPDAEVPVSPDPTEAVSDAEPADTHRQHDVGQVGGGADEIRRHTEMFLARWSAIDWNDTSVDGEALREMRKDLFAIGFHALSIEQMIGHRMEGDVSLQLDSLALVSSALRDFSRMLSAGSGRVIDVTIIGEDNRIDVQLLVSAVKILQGMIADVARQCPDIDLRVEIVVQEQNGSLIWSLRDNGKNHMSETVVDPDEYFNFYPSLRETCKTLAELQSLLWVEPDRKHETRFAFSLPLTPDGGGFVMWNHGEKSFAVLSNQVSNVVAEDEVNVEADNLGQYIMHDGRRVPVIHLGDVCDGVEINGKTLVVLGHVDMRVAFYVDDVGDVVEGKWLRGAVSAWKGLRNGVAEVNGKRATVLEATDLLEHYLGHTFSAKVTEAGGSLDDSGVTSNARESKISTPLASGNVLVIERSESLRNELESILMESHLTMKAFDQIDAAIDWLHDDLPCVIISEFRVPSMAAKVLVERLRLEGKDVPVLVTTTHSGEKAEKLVQKLGVSGYIVKPLDAASVLTCVEDVLKAVPSAVTKA